MHSGNWDDLRFFLAVADGGSMSEAARVLGVNQSTVFRRLGQLEDQLGARLFERRTRGTVLTGVGERMLPLARQVADDVAAVDRAVEGADQALTGKVRVTTVLELFQLIAPWFADFRGRYPGIDLEVSTDPRVFSLERNEADVAIRPGLAPSEPDVIGSRLAPSGLAVYGSPTYLEPRRRPSGMDDLDGHDWVGFQPRSGRTEAAPRGCRVTIELDSKLGQAAAVRAGLGLAALPMFVGHGDPGLVRLFDVPSEGAYLWLLFHRDLRQTARLRAFVDHLRQRVEESPGWFAR